LACPSSGGTRTPGRICGASHSPRTDVERDAHRASLNRRLRAAFIEDAERQSREDQGQGLTADELERVLLLCVGEIWIASGSVENSPFGSIGTHKHIAGWCKFLAREDGSMRLELTRRGDYGVRAILALAGVGGGDSSGNTPLPMSVTQIARSMAIPPRILPSVMQRLGWAGLVTAREGRSGGYVLARPASSISLLEIIEAVEGEARLRSCVLHNAPCGSRGECAVHATFARAHDRLRAELNRPGISRVDRDRRRPSARVPVRQETRVPVRQESGA